MNRPIDQIVYPGSDQYSAQELAAPGTIPVELYDEPIARAVNTAYIMFQVPDLQQQKAFLLDFGMIVAEEAAQTLHMRGYGTAPFIYIAQKGDDSRFLGAGFKLESEEVLNKVAGETGVPIETIEGPGAGKRVRLTDPDGFIVDLVYGCEEVAALETRRE